MYVAIRKIWLLKQKFKVRCCLDDDMNDSTPLGLNPWLLDHLCFSCSRVNFLRLFSVTSRHAGSSDTFVACSQRLLPAGGLKQIKRATVQTLEITRQPQTPSCSHRPVAQLLGHAVS